MTAVALGADHAGFPLKQDLKEWLVGAGFTVVDVGTHSLDSVDYPDFAAAAADVVIGGEAERGILVCGSGIGMAIAANKVPGIRAAVCGDVETARLSRRHNDLNVLALAGRTTSRDQAIAIVRAWLETAFEGGRHTQRLAKVAGLEQSGSSVEGKVAGAPAR